MQRRSALVSWLLLVGMAGCGGESPPPLESLTLREALSAEPRVIQGLPEAARRKLAERLEAARAEAGSTEPVPVESAAPAASSSASTREAAILVRGVDAARERAGRDAVIVAQVERTPETVLVHPVPDAVAEVDGPALPPWNIEGETAEAERRALAGPAGAPLRALLQASGARRLVRVVAWPSAAVAIGDAVYVNAAWLVVLASREEVDAGASVATSSGSRGGRGAAIALPFVLAGAAGADDRPDGATLSIEADPGEIPPDMSMPNQKPPAQKGCGSCGSSSVGDACAGTACAACIESINLCSACDSSSCDESSSDACESSGDSCDSGGESCGGDSCRVGSRRPAFPVPAGMAAWLLAPLALLLAAGRRRR